jgi:hypothetical protein
MSFPLREQLAALLCRLGGIPHGHQKLMTADQVISLFEADHWPIRKADGGNDVFWNCWHRFISEHRHKTSTIDVPQIAKRKRIRRAMEQPRPASRWPQGRKIRSRGFARRPQ